MSYQHRRLAMGRWHALSLAEQMANIGSEVYRSISSKKRGDIESSDLACDRALELFDLTLQDKKNRRRSREIARAREAFVDYFKFGNSYRQTSRSINEYFYQFNYLARAGR